MRERRSFLRAIAALAAGIPWPSTDDSDAHVRSSPVVRDSRYRLLRRLRGVERLVFERLRHPGGWDGRGGDRYVHQLWCVGAYDGHGGDWDTMRCTIETHACRADPILRLIGAGDFTWEEAAYIQTHLTRLRLASPVSLEIYGETHDGGEVLAVITSNGGGLSPKQWTAPAPRWRDA